MNIRVPRQINGKNGIEKIHNLFKKGNRVYTKGYRVQEFIGYLDIEKILNLSKQEMKVLYDLF